MKIRFGLAFVGAFLILYSLSFVSAASFQLNGTVYDVYGNALNNSNVSILIRDQSWAQVAQNYTNTSVSGWFNIELDADSTYMYQLSITHTNATIGSVDWVGQSLPAFPYQAFSQLAGTNHYLRQAGTINITVINSSNSKVPNSQFSYQVKDAKLGYPIGSCVNSGSFSTLCYVSKSRNYSIMVYPAQGSPQHFVPVSFDWNNFSSTSDYTIGTSSSYNSTRALLNKQFNVTESMARITGHINMSGIGGWSELTVVPILLESGNMVFMNYGTLPWNASAWRQQSDIYNATSGLYNISVPYAPAETVKFILFASAKNGTTYYGSYRNITVSGDLSANFTMYGLLGDNSNINMTNASGEGTYIVNTKRQAFNLINSTNSILNRASAHIEVAVDYSSYNATQFTFMEDLSPQSSNAVFSLPLLNVTGVKEINVFSQTYAPKRVSTRTADQLISNSNISMKTFNPQAVSGSLTSTVNIYAFNSNSTCDVPSPPAGCLLTSFTPSNDSGMLSLVVGGAALSLRITYGSISVHYVNVDLLASGPPDADFDSSATTSTTNGFSSAMKFGSSGPKIYDYVYVAIPYTEGSSTQTGLNETSAVNISIPTFYDEGWTTPIWTTSSNGVDAGALAGNYSHYSARQSEWQILMNSNNTCYKTTTGLLQINSSVPCHMQTADNKIWIRLPHFSGTSPTISGLTIAAEESSESSGSGGGGSSVTSWKTTYLVSESQLQSGYTKLLSSKERIRTKVGNSDHYVGIFSLTSSTATINVSSRSQQAVFNIGDEKKFEVTDDEYYDLLVKLNDIKSSKANITITSIHEKIAAPAAQQQTNQTQDKAGTITSTGAGSATTEESSIFKSTWFWVAVIIIAVVAVLILLAYEIYKKKRYYHKGYGKKWD